MNNQNLILSDLWELCYRAYTGTSFSPEKRADQTIKEYSELLENDLKELGENTGNYKEKFITYFRDWMNAKSNCISSMIAGPSNFPVNKARKANSREHAKSEEFFKWREKYFKAVNRQKTLSPEEELDIALARLDELILLQDMMKQANKILKKHGVSQAAFVALEEIGMKPELITEITQPGKYYGIGFPRFSLTNNNATIKRTEEKIKIMRVRIERKENFEDLNFSGGRITIEDDRVKIFHESKPSQDVINELKSSGFRWSPFWKCWCRKHTGNAIQVSKNLSFVKN